MNGLDSLKQQVDLNELAALLGMRCASRSRAGNASYHSPLRDDRHASVSVYVRNGIQRWKDHATDEGGSCIDLVLYSGMAHSVAEASRWLREQFRLSEPRPARSPIQQSRESWLAERCQHNPGPARDWLGQVRGIADAVLDYAIASKSLGYSDYTSSKPAGDTFHGGPAAAFICRDLSRRQVQAVEYRYLDPALNGGVKNHCHGSKTDTFWCTNPGNIQAAHTLVLVESAINALSVESAIVNQRRFQGWSALALLGASNLQARDWQALAGKTIIIAMDNDAPAQSGPHRGYAAGDRASWALHEQLLRHNIAAHLVDHRPWEELNDLNDLLCQRGDDAVRQAITTLQPWLIPGVPADGGRGQARLWLPDHDFARYGQFQVRPDFTSFQRPESSRDGEQRQHSEDLCGFRVAALSRIRIQSATATLQGGDDNQPTIVFAASVQSARHGPRLQRQVFTDEQLYNPERWRGFGGAIYKPAQFSRLLNILERATDIGGRDAINFVGLAWRSGQLTVNEGPDCYFTEPEKQCPYHNLRFPTGPASDAGTVIRAWQRTFGQNAACLLLAWSLAGHLKAILGFWPHMILQADKGAGKSTLIKRLERTIGFTMFSGQSLQTEFRLVTSVAHSSHPVGWEELSARRGEMIDRAVALLQETYQYSVTRRGAELTEYVLCAPVLLAGEDVPVQSLLGKVVRTELRHKGPLLDDSLPTFPLRRWLDFLVQLSPERVRELHQQQQAHCTAHSAATADAAGASRMIGNYAALATGWQLLCEFAELPVELGDFMPDLLQTMNSHVLETGNEREPWVWIMEIILGELDADHYQHPWRYEQAADDWYLYIRTPHIMQHLSQTPALRSKYDALPIKSDRVLKKQLLRAGILDKAHDDRERRIDGRRCAHMSGLSIRALESYGLSPLLPDPEPTLQ